jgi:hypothetical protein
MVELNKIAPSHPLSTHTGTCVKQSSDKCILIIKWFVNKKLFRKQNTDESHCVKVERTNESIAK